MIIYIYLYIYIIYHILNVIPKPQPDGSRVYYDKPRPILLSTTRSDFVSVCISGTPEIGADKDIGCVWGNCF